jgi:hypothetical protein
MAYPTPLFDQAGTLTGAVNMLVDISDRKRTEELLAKHRDEQATFYQFTDRLYRSVAANDVYQAALDAIRQSLGCRSASIFLCDDAGAEWFSPAKSKGEFTPQAAGRYALAAFGKIRSDFRRRPETNG